MNNFTHKTRLKKLIILNNQIDKIIADIGRLSSYNQSASENISMIKLEKMNFLHNLMEKRTRVLKRLGETQ